MPRQGDCLLLSVADTGVGMDVATQARNVEPFFTTKAVGRGTGLGLATVAALVERAHGEIRVHSEPQRGTTFAVCLPVHGAVPDALQSPHAVAPPHGTKCVLVVDDDPDRLGRPGARCQSRAGLRRQGHRASRVEAISHMIACARPGWTIAPFTTWPAWWRTSMS